MTSREGGRAGRKIRNGMPAVQSELDDVANEGIEANEAGIPRLVGSK